MPAADFPPDTFLLRPDDPAGIGRYLESQGRLAAGENVRGSELAGAGNMNCVVRVRTDRRTLILKQALPWVQKYPQIAAPWDRALVEASFYAAARRSPEAALMMPDILWLDEDARLLALEDLGAAADLSSLYSGASKLEPAELRLLLRFLSSLHSIALTADEHAALANRAMRELNHEHIFDLPLRPDSGVDVDQWTPGLAEAARSLKEDAAYVAAVRALGERYLADRPDGVLLHGDFFPGSFLRRSGGGLCVIDPEFGFPGDAEFDVGVLWAHLHLSRQEKKLLAQTWEDYRPSGDWAPARARQYAGAEIMRRLLGVAQLPLVADLARKKELLELSRRLVLEPEKA